MYTFVGIIILAVIGIISYDMYHQYTQPYINDPEEDEAQIAYITKWRETHMQ